MSVNIPTLKTEIDTDPLTRGYSGMTDIQVADDMNLVNRPDSILAIEKIIKFLLLENTHKTDGTDTQDRSIWQRMKEVVALSTTPTAAGSNPWGSTAVGTITEIQQIKTHQLLELFTLSAQGNLNVDISDSKFKVYLAGTQAAGCMSTAQETAFLALEDNLQSRGNELSLGNIRQGDVIEARKP